MMHIISYSLSAILYDTKFINFKSLNSITTYKFLAMKLLFSAFAYVVKYMNRLDAHVYLSWWVIFSIVVFCAACLVPECPKHTDKQKTAVISPNTFNTQ
jgi:hypothetical protein